jgi:hypothetical protein
MAFDAIRIEGRLFNPEYLAKGAHRDAPKQSDADYQVPKCLRLRDDLEERGVRGTRGHHLADP